MPYAAESRPTNPQSTSTSADRPSTRRASSNAEGTAPPRNCDAVARHRPNVTDETADDDASLTAARCTEGAEGGGHQRREQHPDEQCHVILSASTDG